MKKNNTLPTNIIYAHNTHSLLYILLDYFKNELKYLNNYKY